MSEMEWLCFPSPLDSLAIHLPDPIARQLESIAVQDADKPSASFIPVMFVWAYLWPSKAELVKLTNGTSNRLAVGAWSVHGSLS